MFDRSSMRPGEWLVYVSVVFLFATALGLELVAPDLLESIYPAEDGVLEWLIVIIFAFLAGLCFWRALQLRLSYRMPVLSPDRIQVPLYGR